MRMSCMLVLASLLLLPMLAFAVPTGLNMMPTAESLPAATTRLDAESSGSGKLFVPDGSSVYGSEFGVMLGAEGGIDQVSGGTRYNGKWVFKSEGLVFPALAAGIQNVGSGTSAQYYLVATKSLLPTGMVKAHAGMMRASGEYVTMLGASGRLGPITVKVDRLNGGPRDGQAYGASITFSTFTVTGTHYDYDDMPDENTVTVSYLYKTF